MAFITRFAPSPTGPLHLGHAYSAILAHDMAMREGGRFLLRIEDTDIARVRPEWEALIYDDLHWLGLDWPEPVLRQSGHLARYDGVLDGLAARGLVFPCRCSRADIRAALSAPQEGAATGEGVYPGTCRNRAISERLPGDAIRLHLERALAEVTPVFFTETGPRHPGHHRLDAGTMLRETGDAVLGRKDIATVSYVLAAVLDDARQGVTHVIRGEDLFEITFLQVLLQGLLSLPTPTYHHHRLIRDENGKRLAKRDDARALSRYRAEGATSADIRRMVGL